MHTTTEKPQSDSLTLLLDAEGEWHLNGNRVENRAVRTFFHQSMVRSDNKRLELVVGHQKARVIPTETPTFARRITGTTPDGLLRIQCLCGKEYSMHPASLRYLGKKGFFAARRVEDGLAVKLLRSASQDLFPYLQEDDQGRTVLLVDGDSYPVTEI